MVDLARVARSQRADLLDVDAALASTLVDLYAAAWRRIRDRLDAVTAEIAAAEAPSRAWLLRQESLRQLESAVVAEVTRIAQSGNGAITVAQWRAVQMAQEHARAFVTEAMGDPPPGVALPWAGVPADAVLELVGGDTLAAVLASLPADARDVVRAALATGMITGESPDAMAKRVRSAFGGNLSRAITVSRTETFRAYREANRKAYQANKDVVTGWRWMAALSRRTCAFCYAQHGTEHELAESLASHPRCRCVMAPIVKTWADLGYDVDEEPQKWVDGAAAFGSLDADQQRQILGPGKFAAYQAGALTLDDLVGVARTRPWGKIGFEKSLTSVVGTDAARGFIREGMG